MALTTSEGMTTSQGTPPLHHNHHLLVILLLITISSCRAIQVNSSQLQVWSSDQGIQAQDKALRDFNGPSNFTLAFQNTSSPDLYTLGILISPSPNFSRFIWEANRDDPVGPDATLTLTADGDLWLNDSDGRLVWSTETAGRGATVVEIREPGNLVVVANETILWQSFEHPTDALVEHQLFRQGMKLQTRSDSSQGYYSFVMEPGGLVLYSNLSGVEEPYWIRGYNGDDSLASVRRNACGSLLDAHLNRSGSLLELNMFPAAAGSCRTSRKPGLNLGDAIDLVQNRSFLRLEPDGNLKVYSINSSGEWGTSFELFNRSTSCMLPGRCQPFGICSNGECQSCLNSDGAETPWSSKCKAPAIGSCTDIESLDFLELPGVEYFSSKFLNSSSLGFETCRMECLRNCSCRAFFYWGDSNSCFMTSEVNTLEKVGNLTHVAYLKVSRGPGSGLAPGATAGIVVGCLALALAIVALLITFCLRRRKRSISVDFESDEDSGESPEHPKPVRFSYSELDRITEGFSKALGDGVYQGVLEDGKKVVVRDVEKAVPSKRKFLAKVSLLSRVHHWNVVKLVGLCSEEYKRLLVYEQLENGSLENWIYRDSGESFLEWELRMGVMLGVARALAYLHDECMERIAHLDVKPRNILLDSSFVAKLSGLGQFHRPEKIGGSDEGYCSPEVLQGGLVSDKSDVYSFGMVLLEVVSGLRCLDEEQKFYLPEFALEMVERGRERELVDPRIVRNLGEAGSALSIAFMCLQEDPGLRPSMRRLVAMLEGSSEIAQTPSDHVWRMP